MRKFSLPALLTCTTLTIGCPGDDGREAGTSATESDSSTSTSTSESESSGSTDTSTSADTTTETETDTETETETGEPDPVCGDGNVDPDEECDDGNSDDTDECTAACTLAICGDLFVQLGVEACDDGNMDDGDGCSAACLLESCGDAIVQPLEGCDDGNDVDTDECTNMCTLAVCGDMIVQEGVEQCDDANGVDTDDCTNVCALAACGDAIVQEGVEQCDDGNADDTDDCLNACVIATCGDGVIQAGVEECDDANVDANDGCAPACSWERRFVFVTSTLQYGNMNGLAGADAICNDLAEDAGLPGTYKAWLSTNQMNGTPATRFLQSAVPYVKVDGVKVADNWADLIDGSLDSAINRTELNGPPPAGNPTCGNASVWSNTNANGTIFNPINSCANFNSNVSAGHWGQSNLVNAGWSTACSGGTCSWQEPMYCFQQ